MGKKIIKRVVTCKGCNRKLNLDEITKLGYVETMGKVKSIYCPYCDEQFILD